MVFTQIIDVIGGNLAGTIKSIFEIFKKKVDIWLSVKKTIANVWLQEIFDDFLDFWWLM